MRNLGFLLPIAYSIVGVCLVTVFGGAGHGWGIEAFYYLNWPGALLVEDSSQALLWCFIAGNAQWALIGCIAGRWIRRKRAIRRSPAKMGNVTLQEPGLRVRNPSCHPHMLLPIQFLLPQRRSLFSGNTPHERSRAPSM